VILAASAAAALLVLAACGSEKRVQAPAPTLAETGTAQAEFRELQSRWLELDPPHRPKLSPALEEFLNRHPADGRARLVRVYLARVRVQENRGEDARATLAPVLEGPRGSARDLAVVVDAARLLREGKPDAAYDLLAPLAGKLFDSDERLFHGEELVRAALAARRWRSALEGMLRWRAEAGAEHRESVVRACERLLPGVPLRARERMLAALEADTTAAHPDFAQAREWLKKTLRAQLTSEALVKRDAALAARLVAHNASLGWRDARLRELAELARAGRESARVAGRALGIVLSVAGPVERQRSAEAAAGVARALGLPARASETDAVRLLSRDDAGTAEGMSEALANLATEGASVLIAGVTEASADTAAHFAEQERIPVVLLHPPRQRPKPNGYVFVAGLNLADASRLVRSALATVAAPGPDEVGGAELGVVGERDCEAARGAPWVAGQPRFPTREWRRARVRGLVFEGTEDCTRDALREAAQARLDVSIGLGPESAVLIASPSLPRFAHWVTITAGAFPVRPNAVAPADMLDWVRRTGKPPAWFSALAHDAARLTAHALGDFPLTPVEAEAEVSALHQRAGDALARVEAPLWTTAKRGFHGGRVLERELATLSVPQSGIRAP
jgi:predicted negative regulator of RcsB-dependent stress response